MSRSPVQLTAAQQAELRAAIEAQLRRLERSMATTSEAMRPITLDQTAVGRLSRIDSLQNQGMTRNLQDRERAGLAQLISALDRLERGVYGRCESCSAPIAFERLLVFPEAVTCASCSAGG